MSFNLLFSGIQPMLAFCDVFIKLKVCIMARNWISNSHCWKFLRFIWKRIRFHVSAVSQLYDDERASIQMTWKPIRMEIINLIFWEDDVNTEIDIWMKCFMNINSFTVKAERWKLSIKTSISTRYDAISSLNGIIVVENISIARISTAIG